MNIIIVDPGREWCKIYTDEWMSVLKKRKEMDFGVFMNGFCNIIKSLAEENHCKVLVDKSGCGIAYFDCLKNSALDVQELKYRRI